MSSHTALLVIDVQVAFFEAPEPIHKGPEVLATIKHLIERARAANIPVIYVQHNLGNELDGTRLWNVHPDITPAEGDPVIQKYTPDSFYQTNLQQVLESRQIQSLILTGFETPYCIDTTCRRAWGMGYKVTLVKDGHSAFNSPVLTAQQIIDHHSWILRSFATVSEAHEITFDTLNISDTTGATA